MTDRKRQVTRDAVIDAAIALTNESGPNFSVQDVADRAGITHRTIYRHFDSRDALIDAIAERHEAWVASHGIETQFVTIEEILDLIEQIFAAFAAKADQTRAVASHVMATGRRTGLSASRADRWREHFRAKYAHVDRDEVDGTYAVLHSVISAVGWYRLTHEHGLSGEQAAAGARRVFAAAIRELEELEKEAAR